MSAEELKQLGNKAFSAGDHESAIKHFTAAIALDPTNHVLFSNRSASHASLKDYQKALEDAEKCVSIKADWSKGYGRKGAALFGLKKFREAEQAYQQGLVIDPTNDQLKKGLAEMKEAMVAESASGVNALSQVFNDPNTIAKLKADPKTQAFFSQPDFVEKLKQIQTNPKSLEILLGDQRILQALSVVLGPQMKGFDDEFPEEQPPAPTPKKEEPKAEPPKREEPKPEPPKKDEAKKEEPEAMETDDSEEVKANKKKANEEKELGTQLYKKREFKGALEHYTKAWELDNSNIVYLNNIAAVYFEMGDFAKCIETCLKSVEHGREIRADYQLISKAYSRAGNAAFKQEDYVAAVTYLEKSLTEHRTPEVLTKLREAEKLRDQKAKEAYINPQLADEAREKGNALFKEQKFADALSFYTEATKRNPKDPKNFNNRAAAYAKLMALPESLKDAEEAIKVDPNFIKAHIRKANTLIAMKKFSEATTSLENARALDTQGTHAAEINELEMKCFGATRNMTQEEVAENASRDPEVMEILNDPVMRSILEQMQTDPKAIKEHLKNPSVAKKLQKLMDAGVIRMGR